MDGIPPEAPSGPSHTPPVGVSDPQVNQFASLSPETFDWAAFEGTYRGRALIVRLLHVASILIYPNSTPSNLALAKTALLRTLPILKTTLDTATYARVISSLEEVSRIGKGVNADEAMEDEPTGGEAEGVPDVDWIEVTRDNERREGGRLDVELRGYMSNLIKESIRLTYLAFAQLAINAGRWNDAMKHYSSARDYSSSPAHLVDLGVGIVETCLSFNQPQYLAGHISKLEASLDRAHPLPTGAKTDHAGTTAADIRENREKEARSAGVRKVVSVKLRVAKGVVALMQHHWEAAGREMGEISEEGGLGEWEGSAISTADVALITALCTLATSNRERIRRVLLDRTSFRGALDDSNRWILDLVRAFIEAQYGTVLALMQKHEPMIMLNPFLSPHTSRLLGLIRTRAIIQYISPFSSISISAMAEAFAMAPEEMLTEIEGLVEKGKIAGRIDLIDMVLQMRTPNPRNELFGNALKAGKKTSENTMAALIRMRIHEAGIKVDPRPDEERDPQPDNALPIGGAGGSGAMHMDDAIMVD